MARKPSLEDLYEGPRFERQAKRRRMNALLNTAIFIVIAGIIFVAVQLFTGGGEAEKIVVHNDKDVQETTKVVTEEVTKEEASPDSSTDEKEETGNTNTEENSNNESTLSEQAGEATQTSEPTEANTVIAGSDETNITQTITNSSWQPVATVQSEPHVADFTKNSTDWNEMVDAAKYATGLSDLTVWWNKNGGGGNSAIMTVSSKDKTMSYRVYLTWETNRGWKPTKVEQLIENDAPAFQKSKPTNSESTNSGQ